MTAGTDQLKPVCVVYGKSTYLRRVALARIVKRELAGGDPALNLTQVDGSDADAARVLDDVRTFSLLGDRRVVLVEDADAFVSKNRVVLERFASSPPDSGCLILACANFDARTRLYKAVKKVGEVVDCKPIRGAALTAWVSTIARQEYGKQLDRRAATRLCEHVGASEESLDQELSKLATYVGSRAEITADDVDALVGHYREQTVFAVTDAIAEGDARTALSEWRQVLATDRAASGRAIGGLAWGMRRLLDARRRLDQGTPISALAKESWTDAGLFAKRMKLCSVSAREDQLSDLLKADLESKTGLGTVASAVDKFIVTHSAAAEAS